MARTRGAADESPTASATAKVLAANLEALMEAHTDLNSNPKLAKKAHIGTGTIARIRNAHVDVNLATLQSLAEAFEMSPWELLIPNLNPRQRPALQPLTERERELYVRFKEAARQLAKEEG